MKRPIRCLALAAALFAGYAMGQEPGERRKPTKEELAKLQAEADAKLAKVRRVVKHIDYDDTMKRIPDMVKREQEYYALVQQMQEAATGGEGDVVAMLKQGRALKLATLNELNAILKVHRGAHSGIEEKEVWARLNNTEVRHVTYEEEWLVNILDDLEASMKVNIELDARIYKFDVVSFEFPKTTTKAMLQTMADSLLFKWIIRDDTLYVYKERHEVLFDEEWLAQKRAAWKARKKAKEAARKAAADRAKKAPESGE